MTNGVTHPQDKALQELASTLDNWTRTGELKEGMTDLALAYSNLGWNRLTDFAARTELPLSVLKDIASEARTFYIKNPLILRGVDVSSDYVFGRGITITAKDEQINEVIQAFIDDLKNQVELTSHQAMIQKDRELELDGNVFFVFFVNEITGRTRVRSIPFQEIEKIVSNPEDSKEPWYYVRNRTKYSNDELASTAESKDYYRDWQYQGVLRLPEDATLSNGVVFHLKLGGFSDWKFGISKTYAAHDWARAYKDFLQNWATLMQAYARFAMIINTKGGAAAVQSARTKMQSTLNAGSSGERNPPANTASTFISDRELAALDVVKTAGATTKAEEGRRLLLMVAAAQGLPETFYGDVSVGTLATAESLDRPTELKFSNRQEFWQSNFTRIVWFVITNAVKALSGPLKGFATIETNEYGEEQLVIPDDVDKSISIAFPEIINSSIKDHIASIISGVTLDGKSRVLLDNRMVTEMILTALGVDDVDEKIEALDADGVFDEPDPITVAPMLPGVTPVQPRIPAKESANLSAVIGRLIEVMNKYEGSNA